MTYCEGMLELMSPSFGHEVDKTSIARLVELYGFLRRLRLNGYGSTTFRREARQRGAEPDECYCVGRQIVEDGKNASAGHVVEEPLQSSSASHTPAPARHTEPALPAGCVHCADEPSQRRPNAQVEGVALVHLDVLDVPGIGPAVDREHLVAPVAQVTDRDRHASFPGAGRAAEDRLLGAAPGSPDAAQLEHANRCGRRSGDGHDRLARRWAAGDTSASARAAS